jgi:putative NADH-flavin reductase
MKVLIIGATRGIGLQVLEQALAADHDVKVLARSPEKITVNYDRLKVVQGDIIDSQTVSSAIEGRDAIINCIGIMPTRKPVSVFSAGIKNVLAAMGPDRGNLLISVVQPLWLKTIYEDKDREESLIRDSQINWIIVRPGFLTNRPMTGHYRVLTEISNVKAGKISRADVAHFILNQLDSSEYLGKTPLLSY